MNEDFIQYAWKTNLYKKNLITTIKGEKIEVVSPGEVNINSGPDFINSRIRISGILWAGNVEIHKKASDWYKHKHHLDKAYDNVILHVVKVSDRLVYRTNGEEIPCLIIDLADRLFDKYSTMINNELWVPCQNKIKNVESFVIEFCIENMIIERLEYKTSRIREQLLHTRSNTEEVFYRQIIRNFGFGLNSEPFEQLALSLPSGILIRVGRDQFKIESFLFGQAGFLSNNSCKDQYFLKLKDEYKFLKKKYSLSPIDVHQWKFLRLRPANFPTIRIAQLAGLLKNLGTIRINTILESDFADIEKLFDFSISDYWEYHYLFGKSSVRKDKKPGRATFENIIINTVVPFLFVHGKIYNDEKYTLKAIDFLHKCQAENNSIIRGWEKINIKAENAYVSQALLHLKKFYCNQKKCLNCKIGNYIISHVWNTKEETR